MFRESFEWVNERLGTFKGTFQTFAERSWKANFESPVQGSNLKIRFLSTVSPRLLNPALNHRFQNFGGLMLGCFIS
jgi:hypothetical protein